MKYLLIVLLLSGCSHMTSIQTHKPDGSIVTELRTTTFFDSKSELAKYTANQTDKTQRLGIGSLTAESSGTNAVDVIDKIVSAAIRAAIKP